MKSPIWNPITLCGYIHTAGWACTCSIARQWTKQWRVDCFKAQGAFQANQLHELEKTLAQVGDDGRRIPMTLGRGQVLSGWPLLTWRIWMMSTWLHYWMHQCISLGSMFTLRCQAYMSTCGISSWWLVFFYCRCEDWLHGRAFSYFSGCQDLSSLKHWLKQCKHKTLYSL